MTLGDLRAVDEAVAQLALPDLATVASDLETYLVAFLRAAVEPTGFPRAARVATAAAKCAAGLDLSAQRYLSHRGSIDACIRRMQDVRDVRDSIYGSLSLGGARLLSDLVRIRSAFASVEKLLVLIGPLSSSDFAAPTLTDATATAVVSEAYAALSLLQLPHAAEPANSALGFEFERAVRSLLQRRDRPGTLGTQGLSGVGTRLRTCRPRSELRRAVRLGGGTATGLAAALLTIAAWLIGLEIVGSEPFGIAPGLLAGTALGVITLAAPFAIRSTWPWLTGVPMLALCAIASVHGIQALPSAVAGSSRAPSWLPVIVATAGLWFFLKLCLLARLTEGARQRPVADRPSRSLLGFQRRIHDQLLEAIRARGPYEAGGCIQLKGRWGSGKTFVLAALEESINDEDVVSPWLSRGSRSGRRVVVSVDVWRHETEKDLHRAIVRRILSHPTHLLPFGWLRFPSSYLVPMVVGDLSFKLGIGSSAEAGADASLRLPRLPLQRALRDACRRASRRGIATVVVLDELDRADVTIARSTLTLIPRAFASTPGLTTVLPFVEEVLLHKVFDPLVAPASQMPDLGSSTTAILMHILGPEIEDRAGFSDGRTAGSNNADSPRPGADDYVPAIVADAFASQPRRRRMRLLIEASEKLLSTRPLKMPQPSIPDLAEVVTTFDLVRHAIGEVAVHPAEIEGLEERVALRLGTYRRSERSSLLDEVSLRAFQSRLLELLAGCQSRGCRLDSRGIEALVVIAAILVGLGAE